MFDQQVLDLSLLDDAEEELAKAKALRGLKGKQPAIVGKFDDMGRASVPDPQNLQGMKAPPSGADNIARFLASMASAGAGGAMASRSPIGAGFGAGIQGLMNAGRMVSGQELPDVFSRENLGHLAGGGAGGAAAKVPGLGRLGSNLLQGVSSGATQGAIMTPDKPGEGALQGGLLGGVMDATAGSFRTRALKTPAMVAEKTVREMRRMADTGASTNLVTDLGDTARSYGPTLQALESYYHPTSVSKRMAREAQYADLNKQRATAQRDYNSQSKDIKASIAQSGTEIQQKAAQRLQLAQEAIDAEQPNSRELIDQASRELRATRSRLQQVELEVDKTKYAEASTPLELQQRLKARTSEFEKAQELYKSRETLTDSKLREEYDDAREAFDVAVPSESELFKGLDLDTRQKYLKAKKSLDTIKSRHSSLATTRKLDLDQELGLKQISNELVRVGQHHGAVGLDPQEVMKYPNQRAFLAALAGSGSKTPVMDFIRKQHTRATGSSGQASPSSIVKGMEETFPSGSPQRKNFAGNFLKEFMDDLRENTSAVPSNLFGTINPEKMNQALKEFNHETLNAMMDNKDAYETLKGFVNNLDKAEKYGRGNKAAILRASGGLGGGGLMFFMGNHALGNTNSLESTLGAVTTGAAAIGVLSWPKIANGFMEGNSGVGQAIRKFAKSTNAGGAMNALRNDILSLAKNGKVSLVKKQMATPKLPSSTLIPQDIVDGMAAQD